MTGNNKHFRSIALIIATFFGTGYFPKMPGTFASLIAFVSVFLLDYLDNAVRSIVLLSAVLIVCVCCIPLIAKAEQELGNDSPKIVIDEVVGVWLIYCSPFIPISLLSFFMGIGLFRILDIFKPSIIGKINQKEGAIYVLLDDICASVITTILLHLFYFIGKFLIIYSILAKKDIFF